MKINELIEIDYLKINRETVRFTPKTRKWCQLPYLNHPKGCPNYNKNSLCPPNAQYKDNILIRYSHFYLIYARFDLKRQRERMFSLHKNWSKRQANCVLYWQNSVKKHLIDYIKKIISNNQNSDMFLLSCGSGFNLKTLNQDRIYSMEAAGIDVFKTLKNNGVNFELKPINKVVLSTLLCFKDELSFELKI